MVRSLLEGRKSQTRRYLYNESAVIRNADGTDGKVQRLSIWAKVQPGDRLWVRENHRFHGRSYENPEEIEWYRCYSEAGAPDCWDPHFPRGWQPSRHSGVQRMIDPGEQEVGTVPYATKLLPSIHMPRWASRLTLVVTATKIERLVQISEADAEAEGADRYHSVKWAAGDPGCMQDVYRRNFAALWRSLHGEQSWDANPEVVAISFSVHRCNIDQLEKEAS